MYTCLVQTKPYSRGNCSFTEKRRWRLAGVWRRATWRRRRRRSSALRTCSGPGGSGGRRTTSSTSRASSSEGGDKCARGQCVCVCVKDLCVDACRCGCVLTQRSFVSRRQTRTRPHPFLFTRKHLRAAAAPGRRLVEMLRAALRNPFNRRCAALTECMRSDAESLLLNSLAGRARAPF